MLQVIQPRSKASCAWECIFGPGSWYSVEENGVHEGLHVLSHGQFTLEGKLDILEGGNNRHDQSIHDLALLEEGVLIWTHRVILDSALDFINVEFVAIKRGLIIDSGHEC